MFPTTSPSFLLLWSVTKRKMVYISNLIPSRLEKPKHSNFAFVKVNNTNYNQKIVVLASLRDLSQNNIAKLTRNKPHFTQSNANHTAETNMFKRNVNWMQSAAPPSCALHMKLRPLTRSSFWKYCLKKETGLSGRMTHSCTIQSFRTRWILCVWI